MRLGRRAFLATLPAVALGACLPWHRKGPPVALIETLCDDFSGASFDTAKWQSSGVPVQSGGKLAISGTFGSDVYPRVLTWTLRNSGVTFQSAPIIQTGNDQFSLFTNGDGTQVATELNEVDITRDTDTPPEWNLKIWRNNFTSVSTRVSLPTPACDWIRVRDDGTGMVIETSPDGTTWTTQLSSSIRPGADVTFYPYWVAYDVGPIWYLDRIGTCGLTPPAPAARPFAIILG